MPITDPQSDPFVAGIRDRIAELDRRLVETLNARLELVAELKRYKERHDLPFLDPERERLLIDHLVATNRGPLSADGLRAIYGEVLDLVKRELASGDFA